MGPGLVFSLVFLLLTLLANSQSSTSSSNNNDDSNTKKLELNGKVLELDESNIEYAISHFDYLFLDFYAPWCGHCKRLSPELDAAASMLYERKDPIVIAKVNVDKYKRLASKYDVDGYPTLKIFVHGVPMDYYGPRKADLLVRYVKKFVAPDVAIVNSDSALRDFVDAAGDSFPIFLGFGLNETEVSDLGAKYKKKAWFAVANDFSEDIMVRYDFDKVPVLIALHPTYDEHSIFYGPFEEKFLEDFIKQNFLPLAVPINHDTLKILKDDDRKIIVTIVDDESEDRSRQLFKLLKAAASANRDLVFAHVGVKRWADFTETFGVKKDTELPQMVVWDGDEDYLSVNGSESIRGEDQASQISKFIEGYRAGRTIKKRVSGPSLMGFINSLFGIRSAYIIVFVVAMMALILFISKEEPPCVGPREPLNQPTRAEVGGSDYTHGEKQD